MNLTFKEKLKIIERGSFTKEELLYLISDNHSHIRIRLAINKATPIFALKLLMSDYDYSIRAAIAQNSNTTPYMLKKLSNDKVFCVLKSVALNEKTPKHVLEKMFEKRRTLAQYIAQNENASYLVLKEIYQRNNSYKKKDIYTLQNLAINPNIGLAIFEKLLFHNDCIVRSSAILNKLATAEHLKELINKDSSIFVRKKIAMSNILSLDMIKDIANDKNLIVLYALLKNKAIPDFILSKILMRINIIKIMSR